MSTVTREIRSLDEMEQLGRAIGKKLFAGAFIALFGGMGAGKTTFTRALAEPLGIDDILSPTFTIVREHEGSLPLFHFDAYRLDCADSLYDIGYYDYIARNGVIVMEWCENVPDALPAERLDIKLFGSGDDARIVTLAPHGAIYEQLLTEVL